MTYLLAKYTLIFLLALVFGFLFGRWFSRRSYIDVSASYEDYRAAADYSDTEQWTALWSRLDSLPQLKEADFSPLFDRLDGLAYAVGNIPKPAPVDLRPLARTVDLAPVDRRLGAIEAELGRLSKQISFVGQAGSKTPEGHATEPTLLKTASYGVKDNLQRIFGVGPKLERLLNKHGIFYFWQVADWSDGDVAVMDDRLDTFKGRIVRDGWVTQAKQLSGKTDSATKPAEVRIGA